MYSIPHNLLQMRNNTILLCDCSGGDKGRCY